ncbi:MAG: F0F1 ATP synthase subunit B [Candidatus Spechtbacteria bacterium SB0662_bin_43]|uniref:ATP synthase subunit b n=1 Tax=Candidatus Spechtbacteria bacterium SB0662_bin_43 TaxID=2604897 RepID=A0A845D9N2_9BACT|nr:F0F1 ATP synthase subunit B [Candidatus Spechtbacteria bacterium SB0662_bin_43]
MEILDKFRLNEMLFLAQTINYLILLLILTHFTYKPLFRVLNERRDTIETSLQKAEEIDEQMENLRTYHEEQLIKARDEARKIIAQAKTTANQDREKQLIKTQEEIDALFARARTEIAAEKQEMTRDVEKQTAKFLIPALEKILQESVDDDVRQQIYERSVKRVAQLYNT